MSQVAAIALGALLGLATARWARGLGRRQPRFWCLVLIVMQLAYLVFAAVAPDAAGMLREGLVLAVFTAVALVGARWSSWFLALGLLAHGVWDLRHLLAREGYVVPFYPELCVGYDWLLFFYLLASAAAMDRARGAPAAREAAA